MKLYLLPSVMCSVLLLISGTIISKQAKLHKGEIAPNFNVPDDTGAMRSLQEFRGKKVVLYFYPKDGSPWSETQACGFRDNAELYARHSIMVLGMNYDSPESHARFKAKYRLPFILLSDTDTLVAQNYGAYGKIPLINRYFPDRITFLIDENGIIIAIFESVDVATHADVILKMFDVVR